MGVFTAYAHMCVSVSVSDTQTQTYIRIHREWASVWMCLWMCKIEEIFPNGKLCWWNNNEWNDILGAFTVCACSIKVYSIAWRPLSRWWRKIRSVCDSVCVCSCVLMYFRVEVRIHNGSRSLCTHMCVCVSVKLNEPLTSVVVCCECDASVFRIAHNITKMF